MCYIYILHFDIAFTLGVWPTRFKHTMLVLNKQSLKLKTSIHDVCMYIPNLLWRLDVKMRLAFIRVWHP